MSPQQRQNLQVAKQCVALRPNADRGCVSCISVDRDPHLKFGHSTRNDGCVGTLRTQNELLWLYKEKEDGTTVLSRCLHPVERFALQGFRPEVAAFFSKADGIRVSGNAFCVPVVTHAFRHIIECFITPTALGFPGLPPRVHRSRELEEVEQILKQSMQLNWLRGLLAIEERVLTLHSARM